MLKLIVVLTLVAVGFAHTPERPKLAESFLVHGTAIVTGKDHGVKFAADGEATMAEDSANMRAFFHLNFKEGRDDEITLDLYQNKMQYQVLGEGTNVTCKPKQLTDNYTPAFEWVKKATYTGSIDIEKVSYDFWSYDSKDFFGEIGVEHSNPSTLRFFNFDLFYDALNSVRVQLGVNTYTPETPPASYFDVPKSCM